MISREVRMTYRHGQTPKDAVGTQGRSMLFRYEILIGGLDARLLLDHVSPQA